MTLKEFSKEHGLYLYLSTIPFRKDLEADEWSKDAKHFAFRISRGGSAEKLNGFYSQGSAVKGRPNIEDILNALIMDTMNIEQGFKEWCSEYGYSDDSIKADKIYALCLGEKKDLERFFTMEQLAQLFDSETL